MISPEMEEIRKKYSTKNFFSRNDVPIVSSSFGEPQNIFEDYGYIVDLLNNPVADGRHRIVWLIISPFLVNIMKLSEEKAIMVVKDYINRCKQLTDTDADNEIEYHVRRAKSINLFPPKLCTLIKNHPDLYEIVKKVIE